MIAYIWGLQDGLSHIIIVNPFKQGTTEWHNWNDGYTDGLSLFLQF